MATNTTDPVPEMDFFDDMSEFFREALVSAGYALTGNETAQEICMTYQRVRRRRISPKVRKVLVSKTFTCPPDLKPGFELIKSRSEKGEDLKPHQSRLLKFAEKDDDLLKDWGIQHLHLGTKMESDGYVKRTGPLLYVRVTDEELYCINVFKHGGWSDLQLLQVLHDNWPGSIAQFKLTTIVSLETQLTPQDTFNFRKAGIQGVHAVADGTMYGPLGGGIMMSRSSMRDVLLCGDVKKSAHQLEDKVRAKLGEENIVIQAGTRLKLQRDPKDNQRLLIVNESTRETLLSGPALDIPSI